jgi:hypothetical protein
LNDKHKRFGIKITLLHLREICKNNLSSLLLNLIIEFLIITLRICWNPDSSTWIFCAHWIHLWILPLSLSKVNRELFTSSIKNIQKLYTSHFVDTCFCFDCGRFFGVIYPNNPNVEVEASAICWIWICQTTYNQSFQWVFHHWIYMLKFIKSTLKVMQDL